MGRGLLQPSADRLRQLHMRCDVYNLSDDDFADEFNGTEIVIPAKSVYHGLMMEAQLWFGDPVKRKDPKEWYKEVHQVKQRRGEEFFNRYIKSGLLFFHCAETGSTNRDPEYYGVIRDSSKRRVVGSPIPEGELAALVNRKPLPAQGPLTALSDEQVKNLLSNSMGTGVEKPEGALGAPRLPVFLGIGEDGMDNYDPGDAGEVAQNFAGDEGRAVMFTSVGRM